MVHTMESLRHNEKVEQKVELSHVSVESRKNSTVAAAMYVDRYPGRRHDFMKLEKKFLRNQADQDDKFIVGNGQINRRVSFYSLSHKLREKN